MAMPEPAITVHGLCKRFRRGGAGADSLRDVVAGWLRGRAPGGSGRADDPARFSALSDVSFDVPPGEAFGVIGPNGAGKSTLLKLLAGILRPDAGDIRIRGRAAALIELGAGFHGDLTGRENIFLNAAILGVPQAEVRRRFDDIVQFSGIGDFLDTPVRHYSSGMHARLGFAIAAHVDSRVLLVDEVLSVGDRAFRARCLKRMNSYLRDGGAVVFVSHDLDAVQRFCHRVLVLSGGKPVFCGAPGDAVAHYQRACVEPWMAVEPNEAAPVQIEALRITDAAGRAANGFTPGDSITIQFQARFDAAVAHPSFGLSLTRVDDHLCVFETSSSRLDAPRAAAAVRGDRLAVRFDLDLHLLPGEYAVGLHVREHDGTQYLVHADDLSRLHVTGLREAGGVVHLAPRVRVESPRPQRAMPLLAGSSCDP